jgi:predicted O-methyltransferase YrrM
LPLHACGGRRAKEYRSLVIGGNARDASFQRAFQAVERVEGWLTEEQARILFDRAATLGPGNRIVEIGSHHGRSTIVLAVAAQSEVDIVAIDPFARAERAPVEQLDDAEVAERDLELFRANLERAGVRTRIRIVRAGSSEALLRLPGPVDLLYVDGDHEFSAAQSDIRNWGARVPPGGTMLVHDSFCSVGVTLAQLVTLFFGRDFRYLGRSRSLAEYRRDQLSGPARLRNAARQAAELPWFLRNVIVKVALVARVRPIARVLGHTDATFPY